MFSNLVHLSLIRSIKNRWWKIGLVAFFGLILSCVYAFGQIKYSDPSGTSALYVSVYDNFDGEFYWQEITLALSYSYGDLLFVVSSLFLVCDYYKYRLYVNIEGSTSPRRIVLADTCAVTLLGLVYSVIVIVVTLIVSLFDKAGLVIVHHTDFTLYMLIATFMYALISAMETYAFAQIFKRKSLAIISFIIWRVVYSSFTSFMNGYFTGRAAVIGTPYQDVVWWSVVSPHYYLSSLVERPDLFDVGLLTLASVCFIVRISLLVAVACYFASRRRES